MIVRRLNECVCVFVRMRHCGGFSCSRGQALGHASINSCNQKLQPMGSVVAACGLQSTGSIVVVHGLSCFVARGIFPDQGSVSPCTS